VHTFQGKEADIVFIVLGSAPGKEGSGSRHWASAKPNILNVALTRAKLRVYVIGNHREWGTQPHFADLASAIRVVPAD
jgi:superfamily I DNA and/or RNA helicase